jgi:guanylate kinase
MSSNLVTITGPSGSGKTELIKALENRGKFARLISVTTRPMRPGEIDGLDYYFITEAEYQTIVSAGGFLQTVDFNGYHYGTTTHELARVRSIEKTPIVIVEPSGITQFDRISKEHGYELISVFVTAEYEVLVERYLRRLSEPADPERLRYHARRISAIAEELTWVDLHKYNVSLYNGGDDFTHVIAMAELIEEMYGGKGRVST